MADKDKKDKKDKKEVDPEREKRRKERREKRDKKDKEKKEKKDKVDKKAPTTPVPKASTPNSELGSVNTTPITEVYEFGKQLGSGAFSIVREGTDKKTKTKVAIKIIQKTTVAGEDIKLLRREVANLKTLQHPNIMKLFDVYESTNEFYLVMELIEGSELFDKIVDRGQYSEKDASHITKQFISAIEYLHGRGIAHRDLKPENLMSIGTGANEVIKVADFGLSKNFGDEKMKTSCGSPGYVAPEVLEQETYDNAVDMWSIGVIVYILLVGYPPFYADNDPLLFKKIMAVDYEFGEGWDSVSEQAKDFIRHLLVKDPQKRLTATQALEHPWIKGNDVLSSKQLQLQKLKDYVSKKQFPSK